MIVCRSCNANILWAVTTKGKRIPIDPTPVEDGNIRLVVRENHLPPLALVVDFAQRERIGTLREMKEDRVELFKSHFATCPNAQKHRRRN